MTTQLRFPVTEQDFIQGSPDAAVTLVEYGDYECPHCAAAYPIIKKLQCTFGPELRFVYRDFPLSNVHPRAIFLATVARAAGIQNKYWGMHDIIFENQKVFDRASLPEIIKILGLDKDMFYADILSSEFADKINADFENGIKTGVNGTPCFFINSTKYYGIPDYEGLYLAISMEIN